MKSYDLDLNKEINIFSKLIYMGIIISFTSPIGSGRKITKTSKTYSEKTFKVIGILKKYFLKRNHHRFFKCRKSKVFVWENWVLSDMKTF